MSIGTLFSWLLCGLIVGLIARKLIPGRLNMNMIQTLALGVVGAIVGGLFFSMIQGAPTDPFSLSGNAWHGWIVAILGSIAVLWGYGFLFPDPS
jgi:uncharacterized membrane protein YeaQ/YmgE (transglycosylase-associated protein family)